MEKTAEIHLSLPEPLLQNLDQLARKRGMRRAHLLREAIADYVSRASAAGMEREIEEYVDALAPHSREITRETDAHMVERLLGETEW